MRTIAKLIAVLVLLTSSGCNGADMSEARRDHILAGDHGWIDLTLKAPTQAHGLKSKQPCLITLTLDGEPLLNESAELSQADADQPLVGYRFPASAGNLQAELNLSLCTKDSVVAKLPITLEKNHLAKVLFDGKALVLESSSPYDPTSLEWVRTEIIKLQANDSSHNDMLTTLTRLAIASLTLNILTLLFVFWRRRRV